MPLDFVPNEGERMWLLGSVGAIATTAWAWLNRRGARKLTCEQKLSIVISSFVQLRASVESLLVAFDLEPDKREPHVARAKMLIEGSNETLKSVQGLPDLKSQAGATTIEKEWP